MREKYEGQGLERLWRLFLTFAVIGILSVVGWALGTLWRVLT